MWCWPVLHKKGKLIFHKFNSSINTILLNIVYTFVCTAAQWMSKLFCGFIVGVFSDTKLLPVLLPKVRYIPLLVITSDPNSHFQYNRKWRCNFWCKLEVVLMGQLCPGKAISHFSGFTGNELNADRQSCQTEPEDFSWRKDLGNH